jgi:hypothetical protein
MTSRQAHVKLASLQKLICSNLLMKATTLGTDESLRMALNINPKYSSIFYDLARLTLKITSYNVL